MTFYRASGGTSGGKLTLPDSYELCRQIHRTHSRTLYFSTRLFPSEVRPHVHALYAFMRYADEIVDDPDAIPAEEQQAALERLEAQTLRAISGDHVLNPILWAFANTVRTRGIELKNIMAFMESMKMDTHIFRYPTYEDLEVYTYGSAAVVGLMMCRVAGVADERAHPHAKALGVAMRLTNFLRDVGEDWRRGRLYLPLEDLEHFGYTEEELGSAVTDRRFVQLMRFEADRARRLYGVADEGLRYIPRGRRYPVVVARKLYTTILDRMEAQDYDVFTRRTETSLARKLTVAAACAARNPGEIVARGRERRPSETTVTP